MAKKINKQEKVVETEMTPIVEKKAEKCECKNCSKWATGGWMLLLLGGLAHMLPTNMGPLLAQSVAGVTLQTAIGVISVVIALNFLLKD